MKLPYFRVFPADYETDEVVKLMSPAEEGLYWRFLRHSWMNGSIPADESELASVGRVTLAVLRKLWPRVSRCFHPLDSDASRLVNPRQEKERAKALGKSESARTSVSQRKDRQTQNVPEKSYERTYERNENVVLRAYGSGCVSSSESEFSLNGEPKNGAGTVTPVDVDVNLENKILETAKRLIARHKNRACSFKEACDKLRTISRNEPKSKRMSVLDEVDVMHERWCESEHWTKDGGTFQKGLDSWLLPSKRRWEVPPKQSALVEDLFH